MTIAGALGITGIIFAFVATVLALIAGKLYERIEMQLLIISISGVAFVLAVGFCLAAVWTAVDWIAGLT